MSVCPPTIRGARRSRRPRGRAAILAAMLAGALSPLAVADPAGADPASETFTYTGIPQVFVVPDGVTSLEVDMAAASGGDANQNGYTGGPAGTGANGARVRATIPVTPSEVLQINVGGAGGDATGTTGGAGGGNGGGGGGGQSNASGGGGGATDVRQGGIVLTDRVIVAGGGGGGGASGALGQGGNGGAGGTTTGASGSSGTTNQGTPGGGGGGGTQLAGGGGGTAYNTAHRGTTGSLGQGGPSTNAFQHPGGAGGGGYYGGGSGGHSDEVSGQGGGAGGGGGGSSFAGAAATDVLHTQGYQSGNGYVTLTWTSPPGANAAPSVPDLMFPPEGHVFSPVEAQAFTINSVDPDGDQYFGMVTADSGVNVRNFDTAPAQSGFDSTGVPPTPLSAGTWQWTAVACDTKSACSGSPPGQTFGVASTDLFASDTCTTTHVDGFLGNTYLKVATASPDPDTTQVCLRADHATEINTGGRLEVSFPEGSGPVQQQLEWDAACDGADDSLLPDPLLAGEAGDPADPPYVKYRADTVRADNSVSVCVKLGNSPTDDDNLAALRLTVSVPSSPDVPRVGFVPDVVGAHPGVEAPHPAPLQPSATCQGGATGTKTPVLNLQVASEHVWLYRWQENADVAHLCFRTEGAVDTGGHVRQKRTEVTAETVTASVIEPAHGNPNCPTQVLHNTSPVFVDLHRSTTGANPASVCASIEGIDRRTTVGTTGGVTPPEVSFDPDTA